MRKLISLLTTALILLAGPVRGQAATWCVGDPDELQQALTAAATSEEDDEIRLRAGLYATSAGTFLYQAQTTGDLWISGGWHSMGSVGCARMRVGAMHTVLDGGGQRQVLRIKLGPPPGASRPTRLGVANLWISAGHADSAAFEHGGGVQMESTSDALTELWLENVVVSYSSGYFAGGADLYAKNGFVRIVNSLFYHNEAGTSAFAQAAITVISAPQDASPAIVVANSTFAHGRCAGNIWRGCGIALRGADGVHAVVLNSLFHDNDISDITVEGLAAIGLGDGTAAADYSLIPLTSGPLPLVETHALTDDPLFVDPAVGDFRLRDASPLVNQGLAPVPDDLLGGFDLDGQPRVRFGAPDPGPYENQTLEVIFANGFEA